MQGSTAEKNISPAIRAIDHISRPFFGDFRRQRTPLQSQGAAAQGKHGDDGG